MPEEERDGTMEPKRARGGLHEPLTPASAAGPSSAYPPSVAQTLSYLANLIDSSIQLRGAGIGVRDFAATFLGVQTTAIMIENAELGILEFQLAALALADDLERHPPESVIGEDAEEPPHWHRLKLGDMRLDIPYQLAAGFRAGELAPCPLVVSVADTNEYSRFEISVYVRARDAGHGRAYLDDLLERGRAGANPFRGKVLETVWDSRFGLTFGGASFAATVRDDVVLSPSVWVSLDRNVHGFFRSLADLKRAGLARNRGVLLEGPPGTGKTAACRVLAQELPGVTVVFCDAASVSRSVRTLYRQLVHLAPAMVVMEDIDLIVRDRSQGSGDSLNEFLLALDGAMSNHEGVVTIATTNDLRAIDPAARRSARFDVVVRVDLPDTSARAAILRRYLEKIEHEVKAETVAAATEGTSGADLREIVGQALIRSTTDGSRVTTRSLLDAAKGFGNGRRAGLYL
jgi:cell division protease FtsH